MKQPSLKLFYKNKEVGELRVNLESAELSFEYSPAWIRNKGFALSPQLKIETLVENSAINIFLENMIPEGKGLELLRKELKIKNNNIFDIIKAIGADTTGAIKFIEENHTAEKTEFKEVKIEELKNRISNRQKMPIYKWEGKIRLSMAGVQEKLPITRLNNKYGFGQGDLCSTHLLKFNNNQANHLCLNEYYCMKLAKKVNLNVANCQLVDLGERVLCVDRFDRKVISDQHIDRIHIIDLCQTLGLAPDQKYERLLGDSESVKDIWGKANAQNLFKVAYYCEVPAKYKSDILDWVLFNLIIGNCDNHFKNISFYAESTKLKLCPFYDLVSILDIYEEFSQSLAFQVGSSFDFYEINSFHLREFAEETGFKESFVIDRLNSLCHLVKKNLNVEDIELSPEEAKFLGFLKRNIIKRIDYLKSEIK